MIAQIPDQVYQGPGVEIEPEITVKDGEPSIITDADYTIEYQNNIQAGEAKVILTGKRNYTGTAEHVFNILPADSQLTPGSGTPYIYGDEIEITFTPERKAQTFRRFASMQTEENQAWLMFGDTVLAGPVEAKEGVTGTLSYDTTQKLLPLGTHDLKVVYTGGGNLNGTEETHTVTLNVKPLTALVDGDVRKVYDGSAAFKNVPLLVSGVMAADIVGAYADGDAADANVAEGLAFSVSDQSGVYLTGADAEWYHLAAEDISGTVSIDQALQAAPEGLQGVAGGILGVTPDMEYSTSPDGPWIRCTRNQILQVAPGTYYVRYAETRNYLPSEAVEVVALPIPPETGDGAYPFLWMALMMLSLLTLASVHKSKTKA